MENFSPDDVVFIAQQDGPVEQEFTSAVSAFLEQVGANLKAYLCQVHYEDPEQVFIAVCIASPEGEQMKLVDGISQIFRAMFGAEEHVDIMFIDVEQVPAIEEVCESFCRLFE